MMNRMELYEAVREVPEAAKKRINGGRINGFTDINPMWRIRTLTDQFGPCGIGWYYEITDKRLEGGANGEVSAFVDINLYICLDGVWSKPIQGTGGAAFVAKERDGLRTSDECYKMALTDALSVACKALGIGADVYWEAGRTKYSAKESSGGGTKRGYRPPAPGDEPVTCEACGGSLSDYYDGNRLVKAAELAKRCGEKYGKVLCPDCLKGKKA